MPANLFIAHKPVINIPIPRATKAPFVRSVSFNWPASLHIPTMRIIAADILSNEEPNLSIFRFVVEFIRFKAHTNPKNANANETPAIISPSSSIPTSLHTPTIINNVIDIDLRTFPNWFMFFAD